LFDCPPQTIAEQLTIIEFEYFQAIKVSELMGGDKKDQTEKAHDASSPTSKRKNAISEIVDHFNYISRWVQDIILNEKKLKSRANKIQLFVRIAWKLKELNNFETMMAIISSLNDSAIHRLNLTKAEVKPRYLRYLEEMLELMSSQKSYAKYRKALQSLHGYPCIPYLGVYRRDLIYFEEGGKASKTTINFKLKKAMFGILQEMTKFQSIQYEHLAIDPVVYAKIKLLPPLPNGLTYDEYKETVLYGLSLKCEPK